MRKLTHTEISEQRFTVQQLEQEKRFPFFVLLDNIRSLYNVGSIFRTADGARVEKVFLCGYTPHPPRKEIDKTALGAEKTVPWEYADHPDEFIARLKREGVRICLLEHTDTSVPYYTIERRDLPLCLVVGNELTGISSGIISQGDLAIDIPMYGMKQSLNAAVAFGIAAFHFARIWRDVR